MRVVTFTIRTLPSASAGVSHIPSPARCVLRLSQICGVKFWMLGRKIVLTCCLPVSSVNDTTHLLPSLDMEPALKELACTTAAGVAAAEIGAGEAAGADGVIVDTVCSGAGCSDDPREGNCGCPVSFK